MSSTSSTPIRGWPARGWTWATLAVALATVPAAGDVYRDWTGRMRLQFGGFSGEETVTDLPVLVKLTPLRTHRYAGFAPNGADLRFSGADENTPLPYEIESWNPTGDSFVWVKVPRIAKANDYIWMRWGNPLAKDAQQPAEVWPTSASFVGVWHLQQPNSAGEYLDSVHPGGPAATSYGHPKPVNGPIGGALSFNGSADFLDSHNRQHLLHWTVGLWVRSPEAPGFTDPCGPVHRRDNYEIDWGHNTYADLRSGVGFKAKGNRRWYAADFDFDEPLHENAWYYLVGTYDGSRLCAYRNGQLVAENLAANGPPGDGDYTMKIARHAVTESNFFLGDVDEVQILSEAMSATWVAAQYQSMTDTLIIFAPDRHPTTLPRVTNSAGQRPAAVSTRSTDPGGRGPLPNNDN